MAEDTAALVETLRHELTMCCADCNDGEGTLHEAWCGYRALDTLAQRLAEAEYRVSFLENMYLEKRTDHEQALAAEARAERAEAALREIASCKDHEVLPATSMTPEVNVTHLCPGVARRALTPTEEPR